MKIVLINNLYGAYARGGAERVVATIAKELVRQKHEGVGISSRPLQILDFRFKIPARPSAAAGRARSDLRTIMFCPWNLTSYYNLRKLPKFLRPL